MNFLKNFLLFYSAVLLEFFWLLWSSWFKGSCMLCNVLLERGWKETHWQTSFLVN